MPHRKPKYAFWVLGYLALSGFQAQAGPAINELFQKLSFVRFGTFTTSTLPQNRPLEYQPRQLLPNIHEWLTVGSGLREDTRGEFDYLVLETIPTHVLKEIVAVTYPDEVKVGFGILKSSFWTTVASLQKQGFTLGFVSHTESEIVGIYSSEEPFIGFDIFENEATLAHELRHHLQYLDQESRRKNRRKWGFLPERESWLPKACLLKASQYFGELDSTTVQLPGWQGVIAGLPVIPQNVSEAKAIDSWFVLTIPQLFSSNLEYPVSAADWVIDEESCPEQLRQAVQDLKIELTNQKSLVASRTLERLSTARGRISKLMVQAQGTTSRPELDAAITEVDGQKKEIESRLAEISLRRPLAIREILSHLDRKLRQELCDRASGFAFLADCSTHDN